VNHVRVTELADRGLAIDARDWPLAPWFALILAVLGAPLTVWSVIEGQLIEGGGGLVLCAFAGLCAVLGLKHRRRVEILPARGEGEVTRVRSREGIGPFRREFEHALKSGATARVLPFERPAGAPELSDRGADLVVEQDGLRVHVARCVGAGWDELETVRARIAAVLP